MMPIGPLMIEHRLIERMISVLEMETARMTATRAVDHDFLESAVDFIRTYADRCHHGKEEDILFRELVRKRLTEDHSRILRELIEEHRRGRELTRQLVAANRRHRSGDDSALTAILECLHQLTGFYPGHIDKEDREFFIPVMNYFTDQERDDLLKEEREFDRNLIHKMYGEVVTRFEKEKKGRG